MAARRTNPMSKEPRLCGCRRAYRSYPTLKVRRGSGEEISLVQGKEQWLHFTGAAMKRYPMSKAKLMSPRLRSGVAAERSYPTRSGAVAKRSNPTTKEQWLCGCRRAERSYSTFKVRRGNLDQSKEQWLCFAAAAVKRYPTSKVRETQVRW